MSDDSNNNSPRLGTCLPAGGRCSAREMATAGRNLRRRVTAARGCARPSRVKRRFSVPSVSMSMPSPAGSVPTAARIRPAISRAACSPVKSVYRGWSICSTASALKLPGSSPVIRSKHFRNRPNGWSPPVTRSACTAIRTRTRSR